MPTYRYTVNQHHANQRLDLYLLAQGLPLTRSQIKRLIDSDKVTVNDCSTKASHRVRTGDVVRIEVPEPRKPVALPQDIPLSILYEDEAILVVNKPAGMVVHPAAGNYSNTLVNALLFHCSSLSGVGGVLRPGIVHRLDKGTSGVMVVAKDDQAHQHLSQQFKNRLVKKCYITLVYGEMEEEEGIIDSMVGRHYRDRKKMSIHTPKGRRAVTQWRTLQRFINLTLLEVHIQTGRTHQIRVHLSAYHHPVVGDKTYGSRTMLVHLQDEGIRDILSRLTRPFLHASRLGIYHPLTHRYQEFYAPLPGDLSNILTALGGKQCL